MSKHIDDLRKMLTPNLITGRPYLPAPNMYEMFGIIRKELQRQPDNKFPILRLYCNWCLHDNLDHPASLRVLIDISTALARVWNGHSQPSEEIRACLKLDLLKLQLADFLLANNLPDDVIDSPERWTYILGNLLTACCEQPIKFPLEWSQHPPELNSAHKEIRKLFEKNKSANIQHGKYAYAAEIEFVNKLDEADLLPGPIRLKIALACEHVKASRDHAIQFIVDVL